MRVWLFITTLTLFGASCLLEAGFDRSRAEAQEPSRSQAIGAPNRGRLQNAVQLRGSPAVTLQRGSDQWGTAELVGLIERAAERLRARDAGPRLLVGDLSKRRGGRIRPHRSHQNGRDADLGLFVTDEDGQPAEPPRFLRLDESGCATERGVAYCLDARRTFLFIVELLEDPSTTVQWILIAPDLRQRILAAGRRIDEVSDELRERVSIATAPRSGSEGHRSHLHVRISCPDDDRPRCSEHTVSRRSRATARERQRARAQQRARARRQARVRAERAEARQERAQTRRRRALRRAEARQERAQARRRARARQEQRAETRERRAQQRRAREN